MNIKQECQKVADELIKTAKLQKGNILVVGCSTSEVVGDKIGTNSSPDVAEQIFDGFESVLSQQGIFLAVQCCEHLNRAIIVSKDAVPFAEIVNVIPQPKAGGSMATQAYAHFKNPVVVEEIKADAGIDIGFTLIAFHASIF